VRRGIYRRHCSSTQEGHFRTLATVLYTLLHTTLDTTVDTTLGTTSVTLLQTPSDTRLLVSFFSTSRDVRYCAIDMPSVTTFCEAQYPPSIYPREMGTGVT